MAENEEKIDENKLKERDVEEELEDSDNKNEPEENGIFNEDLNDVGEIGESVSDFSIGETILSSAPPVHIRQGHNLEELAGREKVESSEEEIAEDNFYKKSQSENNLYQTENGDNNSGESARRNGDLYNKEGLYSENKDGGNVYDAEKSDTKSYGEFANNRRAGRSMLEVAGFEDKEKQKFRNIRGLVKYEGKAE